VVLAVVQGAADAAHRVTGDGALGHDLTDAFFDRGPELAWNGPADHLRGELEALWMVRGERLDAEVDLSKLARAAGLLLVPVMAIGLGGDGFLVGGLGCAGDQFDVVLLLEPFEYDAEVELAEAAHDGLLGGGDALNLEAGVILLQLGAGAGELGFSRRGS
jgi:hypothetical protein